MWSDQGYTFYAASQSYEKQLLPSSCLSVRLSLCIKRLVSFWTDFQDIISSEKSDEKIQISLKWDKNMNVGKKKFRAGKATDDNMAHARCMLDI